VRSTSRLTFCLLAILAIFASTGCFRDANARKQKFLERGKKYFQQEKYAEAAIEFQNAIQLDKNYTAAHYELAQCFLKQSLWSNAYRELSSVVVLDPANWEAQLDLGNLVFGARQFAEARDRALTVLKDQPNNVGAQLLLGSSDAGLGNLQEAMQDAEQAIQMAPDKPAPYLSLGLFQEQSGDLVSARKNLQKAVELDPKFPTARLGLAGFYQRRKEWALAEEQYIAAIAAYPTSPLPRISLAAMYLEWGKKDQAEQVVQTAKKELSADSGGYRILGNFYLASGDASKALTEYASLTREHPKDLAVKRKYVQLLIQSKQLDSALQTDAEILSQDSKDPEGLVLKGQILNMQQKAAEAVGVLETAVRSNPDDPNAHYQLGISYALTGNSSAAEKEWREAIRLKPAMLDAQKSLSTLALQAGDVTLIEQCAEALLKYAPNSAEGYLLRATVLMTKKDASGAEKDLLRAISLDPKNATASIRFGELRAGQGRYSDSEKYYEQALESNAHSADALRELMYVHFSEKRPDKAVKRIQAQIAKVPDSSQYYLYLGEALLANHQSGEAEAAFAKSADLDKTSPQALLMLAQTQERAGELDAALATYTRAMSQNPKDVRAYVAAGVLDERRGDWQSAQKAYQSTLQIKPDEPAAANNLSYLILEHGGSVDYALSLAQIARRALPDSTNTADTLAWAYYKKGIYTSAIDLLEGATQKAPQNTTYFYHLGLAYGKSNKTELARNTLQHALKIDPKSPHAEEIRQALTELTSE
jgi:tetratricopeptide (TPR) repeat protein